MAKTPANNPDYDYDRDTPPASPGSSGPAPETGPESMAAYPTSTLATWRKELRTVTPSDPGFLSALAGVVGMLLDRELTHPGRIKRDKAQAEANRKAQAEAAKARLKERQDAESATLPAGDSDVARKAKADLEARHKAESDALEAAQKAEADEAAKAPG